MAGLPSKLNQTFLQSCSYTQNVTITIIIRMNIDPEIDDGGLRFSEEKYYQQTDSDGEESDIANVTEDCDDYKEEAKSNIEKGDNGKFVEDKIGMDSNKCVNDLEEGVKVGGLRAVFETDWFLHLEGKNMKTLKLEDIEDISFRNLDEAEQFYSYYGFIMGFSIRKNKMDKLVVNGVEVVVRRSWNCSKEGYCKQLKNNKQPPFEYEEGGKIKRNVFSDKCKGKKKAVFREIKYSRSRCRALLWVKLNKKSGLYHVSKFVTDHNHELAQVSERYIFTAFQ
ncbi:hypothetical protein ACLB2K_052728 [Fragaria x ananassa]